jgi:hypothetical protein
MDRRGECFEDCFVRIAGDGKLLWENERACGRNNYQLARLRAEHAANHGDLAGVPDGMLDDAFKKGLVGIVATGNLFG